MGVWVETIRQMPYERVCSKNRYRANIPIRRLEVIGQTIDRKYYYVKKKREIKIKTKFPTSCGNFYVVATDFDRKCVDMINLYQEAGGVLPDYGAYPPVSRFEDSLLLTTSPCGKPHMVAMKSHEIVGMSLDRRWVMIKKIPCSKKKCRYMQGFVKTVAVLNPKAALYIMRNGSG